MTILETIQNSRDSVDEVKLLNKKRTRRSNNKEALTLALVQRGG